MPQTKREIDIILRDAGLRPLKRFGQHFLIDGNLMRKLVAAADVHRDDVVLEVGPGTGSLTQELLVLAGHVVAVEIDKGLQAICRRQFDESGRFTLIHTDILERKSQIAGQVMETLRARREALGGRVMLVANLPYQVATPLVVDLLLGDLVVSPLCFTVQAELADRILAGPGTKTYGPISVYAQALAAIKRVARVPPEAFWPAPKVDSAMLRLEVKPSEAGEPVVRDWLARLVHGCFLHRRKTMTSNLRALLDAATFQRVAADGRWNLQDRPERISVVQWIELAVFLADAPTNPVAAATKRGLFTSPKRKRGSDQLETHLSGVARRAKTEARVEWGDARSPRLRFGLVGSSLALRAGRILACASGW